MKKKILITFTFVFVSVLCLISCAYAEDAGYATRKQQRLNNLSAAQDALNVADDKYHLYLNKSYNVQDIEKAYDNYYAAIKNVDAARKALAPDFSCSCDEKESGYCNFTTLPAEIYLYNESSYYDYLSWYVWDKNKKSWQWFSNEENPIYKCWSEGDCSIKLVKNGDPSNYIIRNYYIAATDFDVVNTYNNTLNYSKSLPCAVYPQTVTLINNSANCRAASWYVWDIENGYWQFVSNEKNPTIKLWQFTDDGYYKTAAIKLVKNNDPNDYYCNTAYVDNLYFSINSFYGNVTDGAVYSNEYPLKVHLNTERYHEEYDYNYAPGDEIEGLEWYLWDKEKGQWVFFSNELQPECTLWQEGLNSIKMVKNWNQDNYIIHNIDVNFTNK